VNAAAGARNHARMRFAILFLALFALALVGCESKPAFQVPAGPPARVALDVRLPIDTVGTWTTDQFSQELATQLAKYNVVVVHRGATAPMVARVNLGLWGYRTAIDVYVEHDGTREHAGRVVVPDTSLVTMEASAQLVAPIVARNVWLMPTTTTVQ
jgi:hypothetical protein